MKALVVFPIAVAYLCFGVVPPFAEGQTSPILDLRQMHKAAGMGSDDTAAIQSALRAAATRHSVLMIPAGTYRVRPLYLPTETSLVLSPGAVVEALPGYSPYDRLINIEDVQNVSVEGTAGQSIFRMRKSEYRTGEYRHCLNIQGASNVRISGIECNDSGGDGLYIGPGRKGFSEHVSVTNSRFRNNRRQGFSLISGKHIAVTRCTFASTSGTEPASGIDLEPNGPEDRLEDIVIADSSATRNEGNGLAISLPKLHAGSSAVSIRIDRFASSENHKSGYYATNEQQGGQFGVVGTILISDSISRGDQQYGALASYWEAGGASLTFQNLTVIDANRSRKNVDNAAVAVKRGGGAVHPLGNVHFYGLLVKSSVGTVDPSFTVWDWSHVGFQQLQCLRPRLSDRSKPGPILLSGKPVANIDIR